jgi:hypothetical protein
MRQSHLPGIELPAHPDIEEAAQSLREAKELARRATDEAKAKELELISRMLTAKVAKHRFHLDGKYVDVEVSLPAPSVRVRVTSGDDSAD